MKKILGLFVLLISVCAAEGAVAWEYVEMRTYHFDRVGGASIFSMNGLYRGRKAYAMLHIEKSKISDKNWDEFKQGWKDGFGGKELHDTMREALELLGSVTDLDWLNNLGSKGYELIDIRRETPGHGGASSQRTYLFKRKRN